jgi:hypothetical protein
LFVAGQGDDPGYRCTPHGMPREASPTAAIIDSQSVKSAEQGGPALIRIDDERVLGGREPDWQSRGGFLMKLTAPHESPRYVGGLQRGPLSG